MLRPAYNYLLTKRVEVETGVIIDTDIEDTHQRFEVLAHHPQQGYMDGGVKVNTNYSVGETIYVQKHADADAPKELENQGLALIQVGRVMASEPKDNN